MRDPCAQATVGRLTKRADFVAAASGRRFHTERMTVQGRARAEGETVAPTGLRFGFTVTKRVGHATERNRIKRRLRTAALVAAASHADMAADVVVIARRDALAAAYAVLVQDLERALQAVTRPSESRARQSRTTGLSRTSLPSSTGDERRGPPHA